MLYNFAFDHVMIGRSVVSQIFKKWPGSECHLAALLSFSSISNRTLGWIDSATKDFLLGVERPID
jgi:hypothetical protein